MGTHAAAVPLYPGLNYHPTRDFEPVALLAGTPIVIVARKDFPPKNLEEFAAYVRANTERLNVAHAGVGSVSYVTQPRRHPLRFTWQLDAEQRFSIGSDEFSRLIGPRSAAGLGRPWREIAELFQLDPDGAFADAIASRRTWSGVMLHWPVDGAHQRLAVELSGLPAQDSDGRYLGYRGFGVCRDLEALDQLAALRLGDDQAAVPMAQPLPADRMLAANHALAAMRRAPPPSRALRRLPRQRSFPPLSRTCPWILRITCCRSGRPMTIARWC